MSGVRRSRWAAIGAAVAVTLGAGGLTIANASSAPSSFVSITPVRVLDTRTGVGLSGPFESPTGRTVQITGTVPTASGPAVVVPAGATAVVLNVTAVLPQAAGFISVRPDGTPGAPETSSLNFAAGAIVPNSVTVALSAGGAIDVVYDAFGVAGPTTDALIDVVGYTTDTAIQGLVTELATKANSTDVYTKPETDAAIAAKADAADVYTKPETDAALATKADIDEVRVAILRDRVWTASVLANGTKDGSGPFTSGRTATGRYFVSFDVLGLEIPRTGFPILTTSTRCAGHIASVFGQNFGESAGILTNFGAGFLVTNSDGNLSDCGFMLHVKLPDPNSGSPIEPLSLEVSASVSVPAPEGATCSTVGETTTCIEVTD